MESLLSAVPPAGYDGGVNLGDVLTDALTAWLTVMAAEFNDGHTFGGEWLEPSDVGSACRPSTP
jgi:hypothetical protein